MKLSSPGRFCYNNKMKRSVWGIRLEALLILAVWALTIQAAGQTTDDFFVQLQKSFEAKDIAAYLEGFAPAIRESERIMVSSFLDSRKMEKVLFHTAGRIMEKDGNSRLFLQVLYQNSFSALLETWHVLLQYTDGRWKILNKEVTERITYLYKIHLPSDRIERASLVEIQHEDIRITFHDSWIFYDNIPGQETALIIIGKGQMRFSPSSDIERHQLELRYNKSYLQDKLEYAFLRFSNSFFENNIKITKADEKAGPPLSKYNLSRAYSVFSKYYPTSFTIENSLTGELLSFLPQGEQVVFELKGEDAGELAYIYSPFSEEEVQLVSRRPDKIINLYSPEKEGETGKRFFISFGQRFNIEHYDLDMDFQPEKFYLSVRARITVRAQLGDLDSLNFNFNPDLDILRICDQDSRELFYTQDKLRRLLYIYFLKPLEKDSTASIEILYRGALKPPDQSADVVSGGQYNETLMIIPPHYETYLYSQSSLWYPAPPGEDYFKAKLRFSVPPDYMCVANGELVEQGKLDSVRGVAALDKLGNSIFRFETKFPVKYLSFIVGKFKKLPNGGSRKSFPVEAFISSDIQIQRKGLLDEAQAILQNYEDWFGPYPYERLSVVQRLWSTSGGHSPASFVVLNELPRTPDSTMVINPNSPVEIARFKEYYIAHEIAHQWWGQGITWASYHDQWFSEGLAQFAAVYYLKAKLGDQVFANLMKKFSRWTERKSDCGPITLGSRLSYLDFDAYQAILYDKSAIVLMMLHDLIGDDAFFKGLREFFAVHKYRSARTSSFIRIMERASNRDLKNFFKGWFDSHSLPEVYVKTTEHRQGNEFILKFRVSQTKGVFTFPLWVEWKENGKAVRKMLDVDGPSKEFEFRTSIKPAKIKVNPDKFVPGKFY